MEWLFAVLVAGVAIVWLLSRDTSGSNDALAAAIDARADLQRWKAHATELWLLQVRHRLLRAPKYEVELKPSGALDWGTRELDGSDAAFMAKLEATMADAMGDAEVERTALAVLGQIQLGKRGVDAASRSDLEQFCVAYHEVLNSIFAAMARRDAGIWACPACGAVNSTDDHACDACSQPAPQGGAGTSAATSEPREPARTRPMLRGRSASREGRRGDDGDDGDDGDAD